MVERWYQRYAWILIFTPSLLLFISPFIGGYFSASPDPLVIKTVTGTTLNQVESMNPGTYWLILRAYQDIGLAWFALGFVLMAVAAFPFRKGDRFAWYVSWVSPAYWVGDIISFSSQILSGQLGTNGLAQLSVEAYLVILAIVLLGLLLPFRKFFPKK
jgi:hypothetical protein